MPGGVVRPARSRDGRCQARKHAVHTHHQELHRRLVICCCIMGHPKRSGWNKSLHSFPVPARGLGRAQPGPGRDVQFFPPVSVQGDQSRGEGPSGHPSLCTASGPHPWSHHTGKCRLPHSMAASGPSQQCHLFWPSTCSVSSATFYWVQASHKPTQIPGEEGLGFTP